MNNKSFGWKEVWISPSLFAQAEMLICVGSSRVFVQLHAAGEGMNN